MDAVPYESKPKYGRPPVDPVKVEEVERLAMANVPPKEAIQQSGLSQGKVYEIYRIVRAKSVGGQAG